MANFPFPWRAEDLPSNAFWFRSGSDGWDFTAQRRTSNGWDGTRPNASSPVENEDRVCYGAPVYAVADGEVISSWRNAPDNPRPGEPHPGRVATPKTIPRSGNHVSVLGDDGSGILYAHLEPGSVPTSICPFDEAFITDADDKISPPGAPNANVPRETALPANNRPRVQSGQFLGRVGNSGASSGPHLHLHRKDADGNPVRFTQDRAWMSDKSAPNDWKLFNGEVVEADEKSVVILASPLLRRADAGAGGFGELAMHFVRSRRVITALQDESGNLKLITWGMTPPEEFQRRGEESGGRASRIAIAEPRSDIVVTAMRDSDGNLRLISWRIEGNGDITRCAHATAGAVSRVALATQQEGILVSAVRTSDGLKLIAWNVAPDGSFTRRGEASAGAVGEVAIAAAEPFPGVVTAVRTGSGSLKLIAWRVSGNGASIVRRGDADAGEASAVSMVSRGNQGQFLLTALRDAEGELRVISWRLSVQGSIERLATGTAGKVSEVDIAGVPGHELSAAVACRDGNGSLRLMTWELSSNGKTISRWGGALAGKASRISIAGTTDAGRDLFVTSCADGDGRLKLINWEANL